MSNHFYKMLCNLLFLPLPSWCDNLMENGNSIKSTFIFNFAPLGTRQLREGGKEGPAPCPDGSRGDDVLGRGEGWFGKVFVPINVYNSCHLPVILVI